MFDDLFARKTFNIEKALLFGFEKCESNYVYVTDILDGAFRLQIFISFDGDVSTRLIEKVTDEEYVLYKTNAVGSFVGEVRTAIENVLIQVANSCYDIEIFKSPQSKELISYVRDKYGDELEYLWDKFPDNAIWRRKDNQKWYGAILTVKASKLGFTNDTPIEILDLRIKAEEIESTVDNKRFFAGYHMNKKHWYTILLDSSVTTEEICKRLDKSYLLAKK